MKFKNKLKVQCCIVFGCLLVSSSAFAQNIEYLDTVKLEYASINDKTIERNSIAQPEDALNGTISGLFSILSGGLRFSELNYNFFIRGKATNADASPLILVDGIDGDISHLNPSEIEKITIIKDASELSTYGMRGANGVILLQTKQGKAFENFMKVDLKTGFYFPSIISEKPTAFQYSTLHNEANSNDGTLPVFRPNDYIHPSDIYRNPDNKMVNDFLMDNAMYHQYGFSAGGGNEFAQYFTLLSYTQQDGIFTLPTNLGEINKSYNKRYNFRTNLNVNLGKGFYLKTKISAVYNDKRSPWINAESDVSATNNYLFNTIINTPSNAFPLINPDGSLGGNAEYRNNPIGLLKSGQRVENTRKLTGNVYLEKELSSLMKGVNTFVQYAFENYNSYYKGNYKLFAVYDLDENDDKYTSYGVDDNKVTSTGNQISDYYSNSTFNIGLKYKRKIDKHQLNSTLSYNQFNFNVDGDVPPFRWLGLISNFSYVFDSRYFASISASYQGSNSYFKGKRFGLFPSLTLGWQMSNEDFIKTVNWIDFLKLRTSFGLVGNDKTLGNRFMYRQEYHIGGGYFFGIPNGGTQGSYEGKLGNPNARWETANKFNVGFDSRFINNLSASIDYFHEIRKDILVNQSNTISQIIGIGLPMGNAGIIENRGLDVTMLYENVFGQVKLSTGVNFLYVKNKVKDLKELNYPANESYRYLKGNSINTLFGFKADGIYNSVDEIKQYNVLSAFGYLRPGDIKYVDMNNDGVINEADRSPIGNMFPEFIYGVNFGLEYKGFEIFALGEGSEMFDFYYRPSQLSVYSYNNRWVDSKSGADAQYPRLSFKSENNTQLSTFWLQKAHLFRLSTFEIGYNIPSELTKQIRISNMRIYSRLHNFLSTMSKGEKHDYETPYSGYTLYPAMKTALLGISINL